MTSDTYKLRRAYAVLGLKPGTPIGQIRRRYKALVKIWHPDRYATDPVGQQEAENRMREINAAYRRLVETLAPSEGASPDPHTVSSARSAEERLTRDEIEHLVQSIGTQGPLDDVLEAIGWVGNAIHGFFFVLFLLGGLAYFVTAIWTGVFSGGWIVPAIPFILAAIVLIAINEYRERRSLK